MQSFSLFLRKCLTPLAIALGSMPVGLLLFCFATPALIPFVWIYPTAYFFFTVPVLAIGEKYRLPAGITAALLLLLIALLMPRETILSSVILAGFYSIMLLWSVHTGGMAAGQGRSAIWGTLGIVAHLAGQIMLFACRNLNNPILEPFAPWMLVCFFAFAALLLLSMNRSSLTDAADKRQAVPAVMRQKNILLTAALFLISAAVSFLPAVAKTVGKLAAWLFNVLTALFFFMFGNPNGDGVPDPLIPSGEATGTTGEPGSISQLAIWIDLITLAIGAILTLILFFFWLRALYRLLKTLFLRMRSLMSRFAADTPEDYIDEISDTRVRSHDLSAFNRQRKSRDRIPVSALSPGQRIRHRYQHLSKKHREWSAAATARENLPQPLAPLYEQARYSDHPITEADAAHFVSESKHI